jgi:hypothetical protein
VLDEPEALICLSGVDKIDNISGGVGCIWIIDLIVFVGQGCYK